MPTFYSRPPPTFIGGAQPLAAPVVFPPSAVTAAYTATLTELFSSVDPYTSGAPAVAVADTLTSGSTAILLAAALSLGDSASASDGFILTNVAVALPADVASTADTVRFNSAALADSANSTDVLSPAPLYGALTEFNSGSDALSFGFVSGGANPFSNEFSAEFGSGSASGSVSLNDAVTLLDSYSTNLNVVLVTVADPFTADFTGDFGSGNTGTAPQDAATLSEGYVRFTALPYSDSATTESDALSGVNAAVYAVSDGSLGGDALSGALVASVPGQADGTTVFDTLTVARGFVTAVSDPAATSDGLTFAVGLSALTADSTGEFDTLAGGFFTAVIAVTDATLTGDQIFAVAFAASLADAAASSDVLSGIAGFATVSLTDSDTETDLLTPAYAFAPPLTDLAATSDSLTGVDAITAISLGDTANNTDAVVSFGLNLPFSLTDAANNTDALTDAIFVALSDNAAPSDNLVIPGLGIYAASLVDAATTTDGFAPSVFVFAVNLVDSNADSDGFIATLFIADNANSSDTITTGFNLSLSDGNGSTDSVTGVFAANAAALSDAASLTDAIGTAKALALADSATTSDAYTQTSYYALLADAAAVSDFAGLSGSAYAAAPSDSATAGDSFTATALGAVLSDSAPGSDILGAAGIALGGWSDTAAAADAVPATLGFIQVVSDTIGLSGELITPDVLIFVSGLADAAAASDAALTGPAWAYALADFAAGSDSLAQSAAAIALADAAATADGFISVTFSAVLADSSATGDSLGFAQNLSFASGDAAIGVDSLLLTAAGLALPAEAAAAADGFAAISAQTAAGFADIAGDMDGFAVPAVTAAVVMADIGSESDIIALAALLFAASLADGAAVVDGFTVPALALSLIDSAGGSEIYSYGIAGAFVTGLLDTGGTGDGLARQGIGLAASEAAASTDAITPPALAGFANLTDISAGGDAFTAVTGSEFGALAEAATSSDSLTRQAAALTLADASVAGDLYNYGVNSFYTAALADAAATGDSVAEQASTLALSDTLGGSDGFAGVRGFPLILADLLSDIDAWSVTATGYYVDLNDSLSGTEAWNSPGAGTLASATAMAVPTGGAVLLQFPGYFPPPLAATTLTIRRAVVDSGDWVTIYQGPPIGVFLDVGDSLPAPLDGATAYVWQVSDGTGSVAVGPITPASSFVNEPDQLTQVLIRALQGAINTLVLPPGVQPAQVTLKMPMNGWQAMPFIVVNLDLIQQTDTQIGEDFPSPNPANVWTLFANAKRVWRVTVISQAAEERDFYRDSLLAAFRILRATAFSPLGFDVSHTFSASSYSSSAEWEGLTPGFYGADLMLEVNGIFPAAVLTNYPVILEVASNPVFDPYTFTEQVL